MWLKALVALEKGSANGMVNVSIHIFVDFVVVFIGQLLMPFQSFCA